MKSSADKLRDAIVQLQHENSPEKWTHDGVMAISHAQNALAWVEKRDREVGAHESDSVESVSETEAVEADPETPPQD